MEPHVPKVGTVVRSSHSSIGDRRVLSVRPSNVEYETLTVTGKTIVRNCLRGTWEKWCVDHDAKAIKRKTLRRPTR
jgi:hypothetical protein